MAVIIFVETSHESQVRRGFSFIKAVAALCLKSSEDITVAYDQGKFDTLFEAFEKELFMHIPLGLSFLRLEPFHSLFLEGISVERERVNEKLDALLTSRQEKNFFLTFDSPYIQSRFFPLSIKMEMSWFSGIQSLDSLSFSFDQTTSCFLCMDICMDIQIDWNISFDSDKKSAWPCPLCLSIQKNSHLESAQIVISGGRGLVESKHVESLHRLASFFRESAVGASRAIVDLGWLPHACQVGQTGKTVSPRLYFAIGISGAIQHIVGMQKSMQIIAINKQVDAPIFQYATFGVVGDLFQILPSLIRILEQKKN